jgi:hypothetical protein
VVVSAALRGFLARFVGWNHERTLELAVRSLRLVAEHQTALVPSAGRARCRRCPVTRIIPCRVAERTPLAPDLRCAGGVALGRVGGRADRHRAGQARQRGMKNISTKFSELQFHLSAAFVGREQGA